MSEQAEKSVFDVENVNGVTVVHFTIKKILEPDVLQAVGRQLYRLVDELGHRNVVLVFKKVEYLTSYVLDKFITFQKKLKAASGRLILCDIDPQIYEVFEITRLNNAFLIVENEDTAIRQMSAE